MRRAPPTRARRRAPIVAAAIVVGAWWLATRGTGPEPTPRSTHDAAAPGPRAAQRAAPTSTHEPRGTTGGAVDHRVASPAHTRSTLAPGTRVPLASPPRADVGIPLPDGSFLPFLNGMTFAPPIDRHPSHGPLPPVVARVVDAEGFEWWEHADGSMTTSRYQEVRLQDGTTWWDPSSHHSAPLRREWLHAVDPGTAR